MNKLLSYLRPYRRQSVLAPLLKLAESLMDLLVPLVVATIINQGVAAEKSPVAYTLYPLRNRYLT